MAESPRRRRGMWRSAIIAGTSATLVLVCCVGGNKWRINTNDTVYHHQEQHLPTMMVSLLRGDSMGVSLVDAVRDKKESTVSRFKDGPRESAATARVRLAEEPVSLATQRKQRISYRSTKRGRKRATISRRKLHSAEGSALSEHSTSTLVPPAVGLDCDAVRSISVYASLCSSSHALFFRSNAIIITS